PQASAGGRGVAQEEPPQAARAGPAGRPIVGERQRPDMRSDMRSDMRIWAMDHSASGEPDPPNSSARDRAGGIVATATVLALLYFGRDVLVPVTLALILSLMVAPVVRVLRGAGMGQTLSVLCAVLGLVLTVGAAATVIGIQVVKMTASLPQYEQTIRHKIATLNEITVDRL